MPHVFDFSDYRDFLLALIDQDNKNKWGAKSRLSAFAACTPAYFSKVLAKNADLSLEQAESLAIKVGLSEEEIEYFLLLISFARSGSDSLRRRYARKIKEHQNNRLDLKKRFKVKAGLKQGAENFYYSKWYVSAIHILITIPSFSNIEAICSVLALPRKSVLAALNFLVEQGLIVERAGNYFPGNSRLHIGKGSEHLNKHLTNWRLRAIDAIDDSHDLNLQYSAVVSLSKKDVGAIREVLVKAIERTNEIIAPSKEEELYCISLDFFNVIK